MKPAARMTDLTAHGGPIVQGAALTMVEGLPAARVTDQVVCPLTPPAVPPPPHVGGPILPPGASLVFVEGLPAARMGDRALCAGGVPNLIIMGASMVFIGD